MYFRDLLRERGYEMGIVSAVGCGLDLAEGSHEHLRVRIGYYIDDAIDFYRRHKQQWAEDKVAIHYRRKYIADFVKERMGEK